MGEFILNLLFYLAVAITTLVGVYSLCRIGSAAIYRSKIDFIKKMGPTAPNQPRRKH